MFFDSGLMLPKNAYYTHDPLVIYDKGSDVKEWALNKQKITDLQKHDLCILDFSLEHWGIGTIDYIYDTVSQCGVNFVLLSFDSTDHQRRPNLFFYPYFYFWSIKKFPHRVFQTDNIRQYKWSCLNGRPRGHRIYNYIYSVDRPYYNDSYFTMHNSEFEADRTDEFILDQNTADRWNNLRNGWPSDWESWPSVFEVTKATKDSYIHLVTETTVSPGVFVTEKTWRPIAYGQLFLILGNPGTVEFLRSQGVDVFDDLIDHSYDNEPNWQLRCHKVHAQLEKLLVQNLTNLYVITESRRRANKQSFYEYKFGKQYRDDIENAIDKNLLTKNKNPI